MEPDWDHISKNWDSVKAAVAVLDRIQPTADPAAEMVCTHLRTYTADQLFTLARGCEQIASWLKVRSAQAYVARNHEQKAEAP